MAHAAVTIKRVAPYLTAVVEVADARAPVLTRYPNLSSWIGRCPILLVLNREDLADPRETARWLEYYRAAGQPAVAVTATVSSAAGRVMRALEALRRPGRPPRAAVLGLPNLGKSTLLNRLLGRRRLRTGDRPGITRGPQWIRQGGWEWLDLPGVMSARQRRDWRLQALGAATVDPADMEDVALQVLGVAGGDVPSTLAAWAERRGMRRAGGQPDIARAAVSVVRLFQTGGLGRVTLERPDG